MRFYTDNVTLKSRNEVTLCGSALVSENAYKYIHAAHHKECVSSIACLAELRRALDDLFTASAL